MCIAVCVSASFEEYTVRCQYMETHQFPLTVVRFVELELHVLRLELTQKFTGAQVVEKRIVQQHQSLSSGLYFQCRNDIDSQMHNVHSTSDCITVGSI